MSKINFSSIAKNVKYGVEKHTPEILIALGITGMVSSVVLGVKATPKALMLIEEEKRRKNAEMLKQAKESDTDVCDRVTELKPVEIIKVTWKLYVPTAITCGISIACIIGAHSVNSRRYAAMATAYKLSETTLRDYKQKVIEEVGAKKEKVIREKVAQKKVDENPVKKTEVIVTGNGNILFLEPVSMRYFQSDIESVRKVINDLNYRMTTGMENYISLSEFYDEINLRHTKDSDRIGWNLFRDGQITVDFPAAKTEKGEPCLVLDYTVAPRYDYDVLY